MRVEVADDELETEVGVDGAELEGETDGDACAELEGELEADRSSVARYSFTTTFANFLIL